MFLEIVLVFQRAESREKLCFIDLNGFQLLCPVRVAGFVLFMMFNPVSLNVNYLKGVLLSRVYF